MRYYVVVPMTPGRHALSEVEEVPPGQRHVRRTVTEVDDLDPAVITQLLPFLCRENGYLPLGTPQAYNDRIEQLVLPPSVTELHVEIWRDFGAIELIGVDRAERPVVEIELGQVHDRERVTEHAERLAAALGVSVGTWHDEGWKLQATGVAVRP